VPRAMPRSTRPMSETRSAPNRPAKTGAKAPAPQ
jgi:hypothetical protein